MLQMFTFANAVSEEGREGQSEDNIVHLQTEKTWIRRFNLRQPGEKRLRSEHCKQRLI